MLHSLLCIIFKILNCDTAVIAPSDDDNSSQYFHYHFYCLSSFHPVPPLSRWNLLSAILDFHLVLPRLVLPFDLNTKLLISQQPNIAQRPFCIQNEWQDILYHHWRTVPGTQWYRRDSLPLLIALFQNVAHYTLLVALLASCAKFKQQISTIKDLSSINR